MIRHGTAALTAFTVLASVASHAAGPVWYEIRSPNFVVWSEADDGRTRRLVWQLEQVRSALGAAVPSARLALPRPILVLAARDERGMRTLAPHYWEVKGGVRPVSVWVEGADRYYIAIRSDLRNDEDGPMVNPHTSTYFSYSNLVIASSFGRQLPLWLTRGLAQVLSNTIVTEKELRIGAPIPWHVNALREGRRLPVRQLIAVTRTSPEFTREDGMSRFDAQSWAFVHYLMFGDNGAHQPRLNRLVALAASGTPPETAFAEVLGSADDYDDKLYLHVTNPIMRFGRAAVDASVKRERLAATRLSPSVAAAGRAAFHVAMGRAAEARALISEARQANADEPDAFTAEALQLEREGDPDAAAAAYDKAVALGSTHPFAHFRAATIRWGSRTTEEDWRRMEVQLSRAIELWPAYGAAHVTLAEVRAWLKQPPERIVPHLRRGLELEPGDAWNRISAARTLERLGAFAEARRAAESALRLADSEAAHAEVQRVLEVIAEAERRAAGAPSTEPQR